VRVRQDVIHGHPAPGTRQLLRPGRSRGAGQARPSGRRGPRYRLGPARGARPRPRARRRRPVGRLMPAALLARCSLPLKSGPAAGNATDEGPPHVRPMALTKCLQPGTGWSKSPGNRLPGDG
jgi:hypothetical protein